MRRIVENAHLHLDSAPDCRGRDQWLHSQRVLLRFRESSTGRLLVHQLENDHQDVLRYLQESRILYRWCRVVSFLQTAW